MKTFIAKSTVFSLALGLLLNTCLYAQYSTNSTNSTNSTSSSSASTTKSAPAKTTTSSLTTKQAQTKPSGTSSAHKMLTKKEWEKRYNDLKPKVEALAAKAKSETNADLTAAVVKMNKLNEDFQDKVDKIDNVTADKREAFEQELRNAHKSLEDQYEKTRTMLNKMHPAEKKEATKAAPAK